MIKVSAGAQEHLTDLLSKQDTPGMSVRVFINDPGTSKAETCLSYCRPNEELATDTLLELAAVRFFIDAASVAYLQDASIDFLSDDGRGEIVIKAPNAKMASINAESPIKKQMNIQTENTPNPATLKFITEDFEIAGINPTEFKTQEIAKGKSILANQLFLINGIESIFLGKDFVTITKIESAEWQNIKTEILSTIMDFCLSGKLALEPLKVAENEEEDSEIVAKIKELIEEKVRPAVAMDGGDIVFRGFEDGIVKLELKGACSGCPSSTITLKNGIESMLKHYIPEVEGVEESTD